MTDTIRPIDPHPNPARARDPAPVEFAGRQVTKGRTIGAAPEGGQDGRVDDGISGAGDAATALDRAEAILVHYATGNICRAYEPLRAELICYHVLRADSDPRARAMLESAYQQLQEQAAKLPNAPARRMFLENVPWHREIMAAWETQRAEGAGLGTVG